MTFKEELRWKSQGGILECTQMEFGRILDGNLSGDCYKFVQSDTIPNLTKELWHTPTKNSKCMQ
jgi:hypothetical protein